MALMKSSTFSELLSIDIMNDKVTQQEEQKTEEKTDETSNIPSDNPFLLLSEGDDEKVFVDTEEALTENKNIDWNYDSKYIVFMVGSIFNNGYIKKGIDNDQLSRLLPINTKISNQVSDGQIDGNNQEQIRRISALLTNLACNTMESPLALQDQSLEEIQINRMIVHLVGVILSVPKSPFSILFHDPIAYNDGYLLAMPPDQMGLLFSVMKGCGVMLCPNNHIYFLSNCTYPWVRLRCEVCGARTGGKNHTAAPGNKRVGYVDNNGNLVVDLYDDENSEINMEMKSLNI